MHYRRPSPSPSVSQSLVVPRTHRTSRNSFRQGRETEVEESAYDPVLCAEALLASKLRVAKHPGLGASFHVTGQRSEPRLPCCCCRYHSRRVCQTAA